MISCFFFILSSPPLFLNFPLSFPHFLFLIPHSFLFPFPSFLRFCFSIFHIYSFLISHFSVLPFSHSLIPSPRLSSPSLIPHFLGILFPLLTSSLHSSPLPISYSCLFITCFILTPLFSSFLHLFSHQLIAHFFPLHSSLPPLLTLFSLTHSLPTLSFLTTHSLLPHSSHSPPSLFILSSLFSPSHLPYSSHSPSSLFTLSSPSLLTISSLTHHILLPHYSLSLLPHSSHSLLPHPSHSPPSLLTLSSLTTLWDDKGKGKSQR